MTGISIFEFYLINSIHNNTEHDKKLLTLIGINPDLSQNDILNEAIRKSEELGKSGWVVCPYWKVEIDKGETILDTWYRKILNNSCEDIALFFQKNNYELLNNLIGYSIFQIPTHMYSWMIEARTLFSDKKYLSCAMVLTAILEGSIRNCPIEQWKQHLTIYYGSVTENLKLKDSEENLIDKLYDFHYILKSLNIFIENYFNGKKRFEDLEEPSYLERNWLMHGMTQRTVSEIDCIKLFNAISSLHFLVDKYNVKIR